MRRALIVGSLLTVTIPMMAVFPSKAYACSCAQQPSLDRAVEDTDVVFTGVPVASRMTFFHGGNGAPQNTYWTFDVTHRVKGDVADGDEVRTPAQDSACGYYFRPGTYYLVFADESGSGQLETNICMRTTQGGPQVEKLVPQGVENDGLDPQAFSAGDRTEVIVRERFPAGWIGAIGAIGIVLGGAAGILFTRKRDTA